MERKAIVLAGDADACAISGTGVLSPMLHVANRPILAHVLAALAAAGASENYVVGTSTTLAALRFIVDDVGRAHGAAVEYLPWNGEGHVRAMLALAAPHVGDTSCVVHAADGMVGQPLAPLADLLRPDFPDVVLRLNGTARRHVWEQPASRILRPAELAGVGFDEVIGGLCLLGPGALKLVCADDDQPNRANPMVAIAERVAANGGRLHAASVAWSRYGGDPGDLLDMNRIVLDQLPAGGNGPNHEDSRIEGRVLIHPSAEVRTSVIHGPAIIGPHAVIENAYIGPYTSIGRAAHIQGAEVSRSIVLENARILHVRERIEGSTIGRGAIIQTGFDLPRAMHLHIGDGAELMLG